ncbi:hypothetical protein ACOCJ5_07675 [Knoellia sp. CPCC 206450]|uniref:hypothetical protein n=1 Tax=Knoellia tibetensis TaxID=3404798 RepID=UPI003B42D62D
MNWWDGLVVLFTGKHVAILGPRMAGKTTLYDFLETGTVDRATQRKQNVGVEPRKRARRKDLGLSIRKGADVPGKDTYYPDWQKLFVRAHIVFYLFDAHMARTDDEYRGRLTRDSRKLREWGVDGKSIYVIGTHKDTDPLASQRPDADYADHILDLDVIEAFRSRVRAASVVVGAMITDESTNELLRGALGR